MLAGSQREVPAPSSSSGMLARAAAALGIPGELLLALVALGLVLTVTVIPAPYLIDDANYLTNVAALRRGDVTVAATAGLTPSPELVWFDPLPQSRPVDSTPVASTAPPLYGVIAFPFSFLGWRGLVALNTLAYLLTIVLIFRYTQRYATDQMAPWIAAAAFAFGGFAIEYAQGLWPHALSIALCTAGILLVCRLVEGGRPSMAAAAGFLLACAAGIRYQNAVLVAVAGVAVFLWSEQRWRASMAYAAAALLPLLLCAWINHERLGSWNPISKGPGYLSIPVPGSEGSVFDPITVFWARLVDFSAFPPLIGPGFRWVRYDETTGAHLIFGRTVWKAFLQSAPWAGIGFIFMAMGWFPRFVAHREQRRPLQFLSMVALVLLMVLAFAGRWRHEGGSYNQRYLLELLPLAAIALGWALDNLRLQRQRLFVGTALGASLAVACLVAVPVGPLKLWLILKVPVVMAAGAALTWAFVRSSGRGRLALSGLVGVCLGWGMALHLLDDLMGSRAVKAGRYQQAESLRRALPQKAALVAYWGNRDAAGPLILERDIVVLEAHADEGRDAPVLTRELLAQGRRVFLLMGEMPKAVAARVTEGWELVSSAEPDGPIELRRRGE